MPDWKTLKPADFVRMNKAELAAATAIFDREFIIDEFDEPPPEAMAEHERACNRSQRDTPCIIQPVSVALDADLLARADALARRLDITRDTLIARGLLAALAVEGE